MSITGKPYDTLDSIIGFNDNQSSLKSFGIRYDQIDLKNNCFDYEAISKYLKLNKVKVIEIQRSIGYSTRSSIGIEDIDEVIKRFVKFKSQHNKIYVYEREKKVEEGGTKDEH